MGAANGYVENDYVQLLSSILTRKKNSLVRSYRNGFSGFAARLSEAEVQSIAKRPGVVSVFPDPVLQLHTTRSWDFLKYQTDIEIDSSSMSHGSDTIVGIIDTGIWPESESFNDKDMGPIPSHWKGTCVKGYNFKSSNCNKKIIGARFYDSPEDDEDEIYQTPRDAIGHGTHVAATAAGAVVSNASYYGLAEGTAKGGSPMSRIAVYRVCSENGCYGSNILAAFDDAIADGVDVLSISLGTPSGFVSDLNKDTIAIGAFHAVENGITVVCSAGNDGPTSGTVVNDAPWILTVAATTIDRDFESDVVLGGNKVIKGEGINFADIGKSPVHPLIYGKSAKTDVATEMDARSGSMKKEMIKGKIVFCYNDDFEFPGDEMKQEVQSLEGIGLVLADDKTRAVAFNYKEFPMTVINSRDAAEIESYINSTRNPVATILPTTTVINYKPAPTVAYFSSRAPGVEIIAAWIGNDTQIALKGKEPPLFNALSGTSMACPHVSGLAASVKSQNPKWSPSAIKSAIMTTASQRNNAKAPITTDSGSIATAYDYGAGEISKNGPMQPGLVYETTTTDYLNFLCYYGYDTTEIKLISKTLPDGFSCPKDSISDLISTINYPSIAVSSLKVNKVLNITRTVTNVGGDGDTTYHPIITLPAGIIARVSPVRLQFTKNGQRLSYHLLFNATSTLENVFGDITWSNGKFNVRTPIVMSSTNQ
ncbi:hypothetical protein JCGZ_08179 [Jatropha curcas]|uniref:Uncharacterized protein n=1 Tax=Jatropha curcas TaxID=180498 RepID=A0A067KPF2_JATCU|nr:hypothetical protein JCGZ_08179 [Jatropha curcas]